MNETLFFIHLLVVLFFALGALRLGKEALTAWVAIQALIANLFVLKQMTFFGWNITCSDVYVIGSILGLNLLQEYYDKESAKKAAWICFFFLFFFALMSWIHLHYVPSASDTAHAAFDTLLSPAPRLLAASLFVFLLVQQIDVRLFALIKRILPNGSLAMRNGICLLLSQFLDTVLFTFAGLYGLVSSIGDILLVSYLIKAAIIFSITPCLLLARRLYDKV
jgi:uncharacterized integral membrane protein (TIGR00697 family)